MNIQTPRAPVRPSDSTARALQIRGEQIRVVYRHLPVVLAINTVVGAAFVFALWGVAVRTSVVAWGGAMLCALLVRAALGVAFRRAAIDMPRRRWGMAFTAGSGFSGLLWGAAGVVFFTPGSLEYQLFVLFVLMGMGAGAIASLTAYMPAFYAFLPVAMLPIGAMLIQVNDPIRIALGIMTFAYAAALSIFARTINRAFVDSLSLRFENVELVQALRLQRDEAERANIAKSKFLAAASHDLRQPLHALTLFTSALDERIKYPEVSRMVANVNASVRAMELLFNALLDISRLDAGALQPAVRHFHLHELIGRLVNDFAPEARHKGLRLECAACEWTVHSDPALLERVLRNLVSNAIRYTDHGEVRINCVPDADQVRIEVADTGLGIPPDKHREIFGEFYQLHNPNRDRNKGLGLGLAIVDRVARLLGHRIEVRSTPGEGSCFTVLVPCGDPQRVVTDDRSQTNAALNDVNGLHVMVVDDEIDIREGMQSLLQLWGCQVSLAGSEHEAVAVVRATGLVPDAIIADYRLRDGETGVQVIERLQRELRAQVPALIVTGDTAQERLHEAGASGFQLVHKPVQPAMLRAFLRNVQRRHAATT